MTRPDHQSLRFGFLLPVLLLLVLLAGRIAAAQTTSGTIIGTLQDQTGATVAHANVTVTQTQRNFSQQTTTNDQGSFRFLQLPPASTS